jgi:hypothetical protein
MKQRLVMISLCAVVLGVHAEPLPPIARAEVTAVFVRLENSGCQFNRNGTWYSGAEARSHLQTKLDYFERKAAPKSAEEFIDLAATQSSLTGRAYQVKCAGGESVPSATWLKLQLQEVRRAGQAATSK